MTGEHILVVEDENETALDIKLGLERAGFRVSVEKRGELALDTMRDPTIALMVLDVNLPPGINGREVLRRSRERGDHRPVILITQSADPLEELMAIETEGADNYIKKPFSPTLLAAYVKRILQARLDWRKETESARMLCSADRTLKVNTDSRRIELNGQPLELTPKATDLLIYMMQNAGKYATHSQLFHKVWGYTDDTSPEAAVMTRIRELRRVFNDKASKPIYIKTERSIGYSFVQDVSPC